MDSIGKECTESKKKYEACFNSWYTGKYLKGDVKDECGNLFKLYKECLNKVLKEKKVDVMLEEHGKLSTSMFKEREREERIKEEEFKSFHGNANVNSNNFHHENDYQKENLN